MTESHDSVRGASTRGHRRVAIVGGQRTPFAKAGGPFKYHRPLDLAVHAVNATLARTGIAATSIDLLACGIVVPEPRLPHFAREVVFASHLAATTRAISLSDNCITGLTAIDHVVRAIGCGDCEVGIAGGVDSMSNPPILFTRRASRSFVDLAQARTLGRRLETLARLRPRDFFPDAPTITEPSTGLSMGEHCELMAKTWQIPRRVQDAIADRSHRRAHAAAERGDLSAEIAPLDRLDHDPMVRADSSVETLAELRPVFDRTPSGTITAGSSSPLTDGAAAVLLMSEAAADRAGLAPVAFVNAVEFAGIDPSDGLLMAPGITVPRLLQRTGLSLGDIDVVEMHEAFGAQVACNLAAWEQGWKLPAIGAVPTERLNPLGSSIAIGHPFAATGIRLAITLANHLRRSDGRYGLISICGAGATGAAVILERA